jgi:hypothetical protein
VYYLVPLTLEVVAKDPQGLSSKVLVTIYIVEINDNSPIFEKPLYTSTIKGTR